MINLMEAAALAAVNHRLAPDYQSFDTLREVRHIAAAAVGMRATAKALVTGVEARTIRFEVSASDENERIGEGVHDRVVVNVAKFDKRVRRKLSAMLD